MGYTHYFRRPKELDRERFARFRALVADIVSHLPGTTDTAGGYHDDSPLALEGHEEQGDPPVVADHLVRFNGRDPTPEGRDLGHETFYLERVVEPEAWEKPDKDGLYFAFCKTARKPYDVAVVACLLAFKHVFGEAVKLGSDGEAEHWRSGYRLYVAAVERLIDGQAITIEDALGREDEEAAA